MPNLTSQLLVRLVDGVSGPASKIGSALRKLNASARGGGSLTNLAVAQARVANAMAKNNAALAAARGRLLDASLASYGLVKALKAPVKAAMDFETQLEDIGQKADIPQDKLAALGVQLRKVAASTNQAASKMAKGMDVLVGFGASEGDALALLRPIGRAATAYNASIEDLSKASYSALENLRVPAEQVATALDAMAQAGKMGAFELKDMAQYSPAMFAAYQALKQKGVPAVADLAAAMQVVRKGAGDSAEAATNLNNVLQKINSPTTRANFKKLGIDVEKEREKLEKRGYTPLEAIAELTNKALKGNLGRLGDLFEDAQVQKGLRALIQNIEEYRKIRAEALKAQGVVEADYARRLKTTQGYLSRLHATIENLQTSIGTALLPVVNDLADRFSGLAARMASFSETHPKLIRNLIVAATALTSFKVAAIALRWAALFAKGSVLSLAAASLAAASGILKFGRALIGLAFAPVIAGLRGLRSAMIGYAAAASIVGHGGALAILGRSLLGLLNPMRLVRGALVALRFAVIGTGIGVAIAAIAAAGLWIYNNWEGIKSLFEGIGEGFMKGLGPAADILRPVADLCSTIWEKVSGLLGPLSATKAEWKAWGETIGGSVADAINGVASAISKVICWISTAIEKAYAFGKAISSWGSGVGEGQTGVRSRAGSTVRPAPGRAIGGRVTKGQTYTVGERRPELFTPGQSGYISPRAGQGGGAAPQITVSPVLTFHGVTSADEIADKVKREVENSIRQALRGVQGDAGFGFAGA